MTVDEIRELIKLASESGIAELEVQRGEARVRIRRAPFASPPQEIVLAPPAFAQPVAAAPVAVAIPAPPPLPAAPAAEAGRDKPEKPTDAGVVLVKSPIVGTF